MSRRISRQRINNRQSKGIFDNGQSAWRTARGGRNRQMKHWEPLILVWLGISVSGPLFHPFEDAGFLEKVGIVEVFGEGGAEGGGIAGFSAKDLGVDGPETQGIIG